MQSIHDYTGWYEDSEILFFWREILGFRVLPSAVRYMFGLRKVADLLRKPTIQGAEV